MALSLKAPPVEPVPLREDGHGVIRIAGSRVTLETVVTAFNDGATAEAICERYDGVALADIYAVISYYLHHKGDVDEYLREQDKLAEESREKIENWYPTKALRERLLARRAASK